MTLLIIIVIRRIEKIIFLIYKNEKYIFSFYYFIITFWQ